jgi:hypothetical protein
MVIQFPKKKLHTASELSWWKILALIPALICMGIPMSISLALFMGDGTVTVHHNGITGWILLGSSLMALMWFVDSILIGKKR